MEKPYDENYDYKALHCNWVKETKYRPIGGFVGDNIYKTYSDFLYHMYYTTDGCYKLNSTAYGNLKYDFKMSF